MTPRITFPLLCLWLTAATASAAVDARLLRFPDVSETQIAFVYAGDIWLVAKEGGTAQRLSSPAGEELFPRFSPDGTQIAFSANYDGNTDVYVVEARGGAPHRLTYHPDADRVVDWSPDGSRVLFASPREHGVLGISQLFLASRTGGLPERLPLAYGEVGALSPDGRRIAFTTKERGFRTWKRYRGGTAPDIWLMNLETLESRNLTASDANDAYPMWHGDTLYFLSDRGPGMRANIWALDLGSGAVRQVTHFSDFDITFPAIGPSEIVFQAGGRLHLLGLDDEAVNEVEVEVVTDLAGVRPRQVNASDLIQWADISPSGKRAVFEARGEVFSVPAKHGVVRNLSRSSGAAERFPAWSPDGAQIAVWSDASGEYELQLIPAEGGEPRTLTALGAGFRYRPFWSPDSTKIAFIDHTQTIRIFELATSRFTEVDRERWLLHPGLQGFELAWSADSRWLAYSRRLEVTDAIFVFDTATATRHQLSSGYFSDSNPVFDPDGKYLYYLSNRELEPLYSDLDGTWVYPNTTRIVAVPLRGDVPSPLAPRNDDEGLEAEDGDDEEGGENADTKGKQEGKNARNEDEDDDEEDTPEPVTIDLEGFEARAVVLPPAAGNYAGLAAVSGKLVLHRAPRTGAADEQAPIVLYDLEEREEKTVLDDADGFAVSADGSKMLVSSEDTWAIVDVAPDQKIGGSGEDDTRLDASKLEMSLDPRAEWRQIFAEVGRIYRDFFYDPNLHGLDWEGLRARHGALLDDAVTRWDLNFLIGELIGEVSASHTYVGGGDLERGPRRGVGLLGVDWELAGGGLRIARIVRAAPWDAEARSPLAAPGIEVREGEYLLAVNGVPVDVGKEPAAAFDGLAGETVVLSVNSKPSPDGARDVLVETLEDEEELRYRAWVERNRQRVLEASGGRVGYVHVPDTTTEGQTELVRQVLSQIRLPGLVIDERFNHGGQLPDRFIELVNRPMVARIFFRHGATHTHPTVTHYGAKAMIINGWAGSGGDAFPWFFKELGVGPLVGERTWGGLIGPSVGHQLIDGGRVTAPPGRLFSVRGEWFAEGHGVDPDIPVVDDPGQLARGVDPQLEAAVAAVLEQLAAAPPIFAEPPEFEVR